MAPSDSYVGSSPSSSGSSRSSSLWRAQLSKWIRKRSSVRSICSSICGTGSPSSSASSWTYVAAVTVLRRFLATPRGLDGGAEELHLGAGVVVVVLPLDGVAGELAEARDAVAVGAVPRRRDRDRARRVRRHQLDLDSLRPLGRAGAVAIACLEHLRERVLVPGGRDAEVEEAGTGDVDPFDEAAEVGPLGELRGDLARRAAQDGREPHRHRASRSRRDPGRSGARARHRRAPSAPRAVAAAWIASASRCTAPAAGLTDR